MRAFAKRDFPVSKIRRFLESGPIVLVSSASKGETNIMTMGWHTVMEFQPSLVGCMISSGNHSFGLIKLGLSPDNRVHLRQLKIALHDGNLMIDGAEAIISPGDSPS